jgi:hypothetical protein
MFDNRTPLNFKILNVWQKNSNDFQTPTIVEFYCQDNSQNRKYAYVQKKNMNFATNLTRTTNMLFFCASNEYLLNYWLKWENQK